MASYKQTNSWREDGYGEVTILFVVSETYAGLFMSSITEANIFELEDVKRKINRGSGGSLETELNLSIDEAKVKTTSDIAALNFVKAAIDPAIKRFAAIFINTGSAGSPNNSLFTGLLQPEFEGEDHVWSGSDYDTVITPISRWSVQSKPYSEVAFEAVPMSDLIDEISDTWIATNVYDRNGYFQNIDGGKTTQVKIEQLVSLDKVLRELADQMETKLNTGGFGSINLVFDESPLPGRWFPARWFTSLESEYLYARYIESGETEWISSYYNVFKCFSDDGIALKLNPDGSSSTDEQAFVSWGLFKLLDDEPNKDSAKEYMATRYESFFEFLEALALNFGCYLDTYWEDTSTLHIAFKRRQDFITTQIYLKTAAPTPKRKISPEIEEVIKVIGYSNYYSMEGPRTYGTSKTRLDDELTVSRIKDHHFVDDPGKAAKLFLTISPTSFLPPFSGRHRLRAQSHVKYINGVKETLPDYENFGLSTAIYIYVDAYPDFNSYQPTRYFTPVGMFALSHEGTDSQTSKLADYINYLNGVDDAASQIEYNIDVPYYYGFSENSDGSSPDWRVLDVGKKIVLDGVDYSIVEASWKMNEPLVSLVLQGIQRFDFDEPSAGLSLFSPKSEGLTEILPPEGLDDIYIYHTAAEAITAGNVVSLKTDGTVELSRANNLHYGRFLGVAMFDADAGETVTIKTYGTYYNADYSFTPGQIYIRNMAGSDFNLSQTILQWKGTSEDMVVKVANAIDANSITFDFRNQPRQLILEVEMA
jgi:hypothetical protein